LSFGDLGKSAGTALVTPANKWAAHCQMRHPRACWSIDDRAWRRGFSRAFFVRKRRRRSATSSISDEVRTEKTKPSDVSGNFRQAMGFNPCA